MMQSRGGPNPDEPAEAGEAAGEPRPSGDVLAGKIVPKGGPTEPPPSAGGLQQGRVLTDADWNAGASEDEPSTLVNLGASGSGTDPVQPAESDLGFLSQPAVAADVDLDEPEL